MVGTNTLNWSCCDPCSQSVGSQKMLQDFTLHYNNAHLDTSTMITCNILIIIIVNYSQVFVYNVNDVMWLLICPNMLRYHIYKKIFLSPVTKQMDHPRPLLVVNPNNCIVIYLITTDKNKLMSFCLATILNLHVICCI